MTHLAGYCCVLMKNSALVRRRREHFALFNKLGLSGPTPSVLTGNLLQLSKLGHTEAFRKWQRLFGDTYGYFYGLQSIIVTTNVELLRKVLLKDAHIFYNRMVRWYLNGSFLHSNFDL